MVLPTYNEAENVEVVLPRIRSALPEADVLVVDDGSPDGTADIAERVADRLGQVHVLRRNAKSGLGTAYRAGFAWGMERGAEVLVEMDADLSHDPEQLPAIVEQVDLGFDLSIGSRYVPGGSIPDWTLRRRLLSRWGNVYASLMLRLGVKDSTSGYRAYSAAILMAIDLDTVKAEGYGFQIEMAYRTVRCGGRVSEVPIRFVDRVEGTSKMSGRIVVEALGMVTIWGMGRLFGRSQGSTRQEKLR